MGSSPAEEEESDVDEAPLKDGWRRKLKALDLSYLWQKWTDTSTRIFCVSDGSFIFDWRSNTSIGDQKITKISSTFIPDFHESSPHSICANIAPSLLPVPASCLHLFHPQVAGTCLGLDILPQGSLGSIRLFQ